MGQLQGAHAEGTRVRTLKWSHPVLPEPIYDIAHLGHVEILTPKFDEEPGTFASSTSWA